MQIISSILVGLGGILIILAGTNYYKISKRSKIMKQNLPPYANAIKYATHGMLAFFAFGYAVGCIGMLFQEPTPMFFFVGIIFFVGAIFVYSIIKYLGLLVEAKFAADESTKAKSDFLSNMSHELRTPINAITGMAAIAQRTDNMTRIKDSLFKIDSASRHLLGIINDILDMSKIEAGKMHLINEPFDLHNAIYNVKSIIHVRSVEKKQRLTLEMDPNLPNRVVGDEVRLNQILLNILSNAVKFTGNGGEISIKVSIEKLDDENVTIRIDIADSGIGLTDDQKVSLFNAFEQAEHTTTRKYGGTGLGLAISRQLARLMHGDIEVKSSLNKGSCFMVTVSLEIDHSNITYKSEKHSDLMNLEVAQGQKLLVADDVDINREIVTVLLEDEGLIVDCVDNGAKAIQRFAMHPDEYDLILMDVSMPVMDGLDATKAIRSLDFEQAKTIPILAMTANAFDEDVRKCLDAGMNSHITKPVDVKKLFGELNKYLKS